MTHFRIFCKYELGKETKASYRGTLIFQTFILTKSLKYNNLNHFLAKTVKICLRNQKCYIKTENITHKRKQNA